MIERLDNRSLSERVRQALIEQIRENGFPQGRLPPEDALSDQLGVSRTSVRAALHSLERDAIISRRRGLGTFVNEHVFRSQIQLNRLVGFYRLIEEAGHAAKVQVDDLVDGPLDQAIAKKLGVEPGLPAIVIVKLFFADNHPAIHLVDVFPREKVLRSVVKENIPPSAFEFAEQSCAAPIDYAVVQLAPDIPSEQDRERLQLEASEPILRLTETHYAVDNTVVGYSLIDVRDRYVRFRVIRRNR